MRNLNKTLQNKYYHFNGEVLYKIDGDASCGGKLGVSAITDSTKQVLIPSFIADGERYFLDSLIAVGDKYASGAFKHVACDGTESTLYDYYNALCVEEVETQIRVNPSYTYEIFNNVKSALNIPLYMIKGCGTVSGGITQIDFTSSFFDAVTNQAGPALKPLRPSTRTTLSCSDSLKYDLAM